MKVRMLALAVAGALAAAFAMAGPAAAREVKGDCSITVDGKLYLNIKKSCTIEFLGDDGSFTVNTGSSKPGYFAYVNMLDGGFANVSWNGNPRSTHADELLGEDFRRQGGCWVGRRGKVCAFKR